MKNSLKKQASLNGKSKKLIIQRLKKKITKEFENDLRKAFKEIDKKKRSTAISEIDTKCKEMFKDDESVTENQAMAQFKSLEKDIVRTAILKR